MPRRGKTGASREPSDAISESRREGVAAPEAGRTSRNGPRVIPNRLQLGSEYTVGLGFVASPRQNMDAGQKSIHQSFQSRRFRPLGETVADLGFGDRRDTSYLIVLQTEQPGASSGRPALGDVADHVGVQQDK